MNELDIIQNILVFLRQKVTMSITDFGIIIGGIGTVVSIFCLIGKSLISLGDYRTKLKAYQEFNDKRLEDFRQDFGVCFTSFSKKLDALSEKIDLQGQAIAKIEGKLEEISKK